VTITRPTRTTTVTACVIGAGFSGLAALRALRDRDIDTLCLERSDDVGGVWHYRPGVAGHPAYTSLHLNTSTATTAFADHPMPADYPRYPGHSQVHSYLADYAKTRGLREIVRTGATVTAVRQLPDQRWEIIAEDESGQAQRVECGHVVVATGMHWDPLLPTVDGAETFTGRQLHSADYSGPAEFAGQRIVVVGLGNSACDIAVDLSRLAARTTLSVRRGVHIVPKTLMGIPIDQIPMRRWWARMPFRLQRRFIETLLHITRGRITDYGIPEPDHRVFSAPITISDELLSRISHGDVTVRPAIARLDGAAVVFEDGSRLDNVDAVIYCTGYRMGFPFLPDEVVFDDNSRLTLYQRVVAPRHPGLYAVGFIRPVGSVTRSVEAQAQWVGDLITGAAAAPPEAEMQAEVDRYLAAITARYRSTAPEQQIHIDVPRYLAALRAARRRKS
jgi:cation diffusion facilitator CzcD-associated flavoprotein CzcO